MLTRPVPAIALLPDPEASMDSTVLHAASAGGGLTDWITGVMNALGAPGAGIIIALENLFPPVPSELVLPLAGFTASQGQMSLLGAIVWTTVGSVVGAVVLYGVGAALGRERTRALALRVPLLKSSDLDRTEAWFQHHGGKAVFFGRMLPMFRSLVSVPAGIERMHLPLFILFTTAGSAIWNTVFVLLGYQLGESWHIVERYAGVFSRAVLVITVVAVVAFIVVRVRRNRTAAQQPTDETTQLPAVDDAPTQRIDRTP